MIKLKQLLLEDPDTVKLVEKEDPLENKYMSNNVNLHWEDDDAVTFALDKIKNIMLIGINDESSGLWCIHAGLPLFYGLKSSTGLTNIGRLWAESKVISFWGDYPSRQELSVIIDNIHTEIKSIIDGKSRNIYADELLDKYKYIHKELKNFNINSKIWKIDVPPNHKKAHDENDKKIAVLIPLDQYKNSEYSKFKEVEHVKSPMIKSPNQIKGVGSDKTFDGLSATQYKQMVSTSEGKK